MFELLMALICLGLVGFIAYQSRSIGQKDHLEDEISSIHDAKKIKERVENDPEYRQKIRDLFTRNPDTE